MNIRQDPIFIVGFGRSGTALLSTILTGHPEICIAPESPVHPLTDIDRLTNAIWDAIDRYRDNFPAVVDKDDLKKEIKSLLPSQKKMIFACYLQSWAKVYDKLDPRWGDKFTGNWRFINLLAEWYPQAQFINIVRDPRDVISSIIQYFPHKAFLPAWLVGSHLSLAWRWRQALRTTVKNGNSLGPKYYMMVRYEDLVADPDTWIRKIYSFLDMEYDDSVLPVEEVLKKKKVPQRTHREVANNPHTQRIGRHNENLSLAQVREIEFLCKKEIGMLGYRGTNEKLSIWTSGKIVLLSVCFSLGWQGVKIWKKLQGAY